MLSSILNHREYAKLQHLSRPCSANDLNYGGACFNCGYNPGELERAAKRLEDFTEGRKIVHAPRV